MLLTVKFLLPGKKEAGKFQTLFPLRPWKKSVEIWYLGKKRSRKISNHLSSASLEKKAGKFNDSGKKAGKFWALSTCVAGGKKAGNFIYVKKEAGKIWVPLHLCSWVKGGSGENMIIGEKKQKNFEPAYVPWGKKLPTRQKKCVFEEKLKAVKKTELKTCFCCKCTTNQTWKPWLSIFGGTFSCLRRKKYEFWTNCGIIFIAPHL